MIINHQSSMSPLEALTVFPLFAARQQFEGGSYSRAAANRGNTVLAVEAQYWPSK